MRLSIFFFLVIQSCITTFGQADKAKTIDKSNEDYYQWITFLSQGEINWEEGTGDVAYRVVITTAEIYNDIYIEKVSFGAEGGNKQIIWKRLIDRESLISIFDLNSEFAGVKFIQWTAWDAFEINIQDKKICFTDLAANNILVKECK